MGSAKVGSFSTTLVAAAMILVVVLLMGCRPTAAARPLMRLNIQSLQRGPVTPSKPSPCGHVPGRGSGRCTLSGMNVAGVGLRVHSTPAAVEAHPVADNVVVMEVAVAQEQS
ncbi:hypothetical protein LINPERHAP2_LOCUS32662 [Linum perenne]